MFMGRDAIDATWVLSNSLILEMDSPWEELEFDLCTCSFFVLHRLDVLPIEDLGVFQTIQRFYGLKDLPTPS